MLMGLTACSPPASSDSRQPSSPLKKTVLDQPKKPATDAKGMLQEGPGKWAGDKFEKYPLHKDLDHLPSKMKAEEAYAYLIRLLAEDYRPVKEKLDDFQPNLVPKLSKQPDKLEKKVNIAILLDASGSMAEYVQGVQKMKWAKDAIHHFVSKLPSNVSVSLRVYGHMGSSQEKDKEISCHSSELVYPLGTYQKEKFAQALHRFEPAGFTPLALSVREAGKDLPPNRANEQNLIYVVSDGEETCGGNPVAEAQKVHQSRTKAVVNVIGFAVNDQGQQALKKMAKAGGGVYTTVDSGPELNRYWQDEYTHLLFDWFGWRAENELEVILLAKEKKAELEKLVSPDLVLHGEDKKSLFYSLLIRENQRLVQAAYYLKQKGKLQEPEQLSRRIQDRYTKLDQFARQRFASFNQSIQKSKQQLLQTIQHRSS